MVPRASEGTSFIDVRVRRRTPTFSTATEPSVGEAQIPSKYPTPTLTLMTVTVPVAKGGGIILQVAAAKN